MLTTNPFIRSDLITLLIQIVYSMNKGNGDYIRTVSPHMPKANNLIIRILLKGTGYINATTWIDSDKYPELEFFLLKYCPRTQIISICYRDSGLVLAQAHLYQYDDWLNDWANKVAMTFAPKIDSKDDLLPMPF